MKKQITYSNLIPRLFATTMDLLLVAVLIAPIISFCSRMVFALVFKEFFAEIGVDGTAYEAVAIALKTPSFLDHITFKKALTYFIFIVLIHSLLIGSYFIGFWAKLGATPGKMLMRMRVVDAGTLEKPNFFQALRRFLAYPTGLVGILLIILTKQKQAWHDKIAGTVVVKA